VVLGVAGAIVGDSSTAARFDGGNDRVTMGDPASGSLDFGTTDFTVEVWVRATASDERAIISKRSYTAGQPYWQATVTDDGSRIGRVRVNLYDSTVTRELYGPAIRVDDGAWHHVAVVFDRDTGVTVYVDSVAATTSLVFGGNIGNDGELMLGKSAGYPYFKGDLDEGAVYGTALSASQVQAHYLAGRSQ
jgi:hypothetical protein